MNGREGQWLCCPQPSFSFLPNYFRLRRTPILLLAYWVFRPLFPVIPFSSVSPGSLENFNEISKSATWQLEQLERRFNDFYLWRAEGCVQVAGRLVQASLYAPETKMVPNTRERYQGITWVFESTYWVLIAHSAHQENHRQLFYTIPDRLIFRSRSGSMTLEYQVLRQFWR